jgi:enoyl-CoA hydratase
MSYKNILLNKKEGIGIIIINRPKVLNALNIETIKEIINGIEELENDKKIKVAVITGKGKAFIAGADISQMKNMTSLEAKEFAEIGHNMLFKIENSRLPFIAAINGYALGGGCETLMACDICIASKNSKIGQPEINLGIHPGFGGTQRLPRLIGKMKAKELLLTGKNIDAEEAKRIGLINDVVEEEKLMEITYKIAENISKKSPVQTQFIKSLVNKGSDIDINTACSLEISHFSASFSTEDQREGMAAFLDKKKPVFKGR